MDTLIIIGIVAASLLTYVACAGVAHRWAMDVVGDGFTGWEKHEHPGPVLAAVFGPFIMVWIVVRWAVSAASLSRPIAWAWNLGAAPRIPTATAKERR